LIVDDEKNIRTTLSVCLEGLGCETFVAASADAALAVASQNPIDLAFVDLNLGTSSGLDLIPALAARSPWCGIVVITAYATVETAVDAMKKGALDYLQKPFTPAQIRHFVDKVIAARSLRHRVTTLEGTVAAQVPALVVESAAPKMAAALGLANKAAEADVSVVLRGESGTGKSVLARVLHDRSARAGGPFVIVNAATLSDELLLSELFGHVRGAFTGAVRDQAGKVEAAHGGTLFLDEIGELSAAAQAKLLGFLQDRTYQRLGEQHDRHADARVITATNRDLEADVKSGRFREDLYYRLAVIDIVVPPLRERKEDVLELARSFFAFFARSMRKQTPALTAEAEAMLVGYAWPGNVRELRNTIERALVLSNAAELGPEAFPERMRSAAATRPTIGGPFSIDAIEREHILRILARAHTHEEAAETLGIDVATLWRKRKKFGEK
jgi:NtrC-family two-component system response regulator AlgB